MNVTKFLFAAVAALSVVVKADTTVIIDGQSMQDDSKCCTCHTCPCGDNANAVPGTYIQTNENCCCRWVCPAYYIWTYPNQCCAGWTSCALNLFVLQFMPFISPGSLYALLCWQPPSGYRRAGGGCCESCCGGPPQGGCCGLGMCAWPCCTCCTYCGCCGGNPPLIAVKRSVVVVGGYLAQAQEFAGNHYFAIGAVLLFVALALVFVKAAASKKMRAMPKAKDSNVIDNLDEEMTVGGQTETGSNFEAALENHNYGTQ